MKKEKKNALFIAEAFAKMKNENENENSDAPIQQRDVVLISEALKTRKQKHVPLKQENKNMYTRATTLLSSQRP